MIKFNERRGRFWRVEMGEIFPFFFLLNYLRDSYCFFLLHKNNHKFPLSLSSQRKARDAINLKVYANHNKLLDFIFR